MLIARTLFLLLPVAAAAASRMSAQTPPPAISQTPATDSQTPPPTSQTQPASTPSSPGLPPGQVRLHVIVTDKSGNPSTNLPQTSFVVQANRRAVPLLAFRAPSSSDAVSPTEVILVIDAVNVGINNVDYEREQIERFLRSNGGHLAAPVSILVFTDTVTRIQATPSQDGNALADELKKQVIGLRELRRSAGFWGAAERFDLSVRTLQNLLQTEANRPGHKLVLWISPGWPYLSGPGIELDRKQQTGIFRSVVEMNRLLVQSQVTLYSIDPLGVNDAGSFRTIYYKTFLKGVDTPSKVDAADLSLQVLAIHSGGRVTYGNNDIAKVIGNTVAEAGSFYTITAQLPPAEQPDTYDDLNIEVEAPGLTARTNTGVYLQP